MPSARRAAMIVADDDDDEYADSNSNHDFDEKVVRENLDKFIEKNRDRKKIQNENASTSSAISAKRMCYCTDGPVVCGRGNDTCIKDENAACFHAMEEV